MADLTTPETVEALAQRAMGLAANRMHEEDKRTLRDIAAALRSQAAALSSARREAEEARACARVVAYYARAGSERQMEAVRRWAYGDGDLNPDDTPVVQAIARAMIYDLDALRADTPRGESPDAE